MYTMNSAKLHKSTLLTIDPDKIYEEIDSQASKQDEFYVNSKLSYQHLGEQMGSAVRKLDSAIKRRVIFRPPQKGIKKH